MSVDLLRCMIPLMALNGDVLRCDKWSGIGNAADPQRWPDRHP